MSPLILYNNKILLVDGKLAANINCCCGKNPCQCCWSPSNKLGCNNSPQVTVNAGTPPSLKIEFEDSASGECGGTCGIGQSINLYTKIETRADGGVLTADLTGNVETYNPGFERLTVTINASDGSSVSKTIQSVKNRQFDANSDGTNIPCDQLGDCCQMEIVSDSMSINLPKGCHTIEVSSSTIDELWHKNAYHEINFTMQGGDPVVCSSELCEKYICDPNQGCTLSPTGSYNSLEECEASCIGGFP